MNKGQAGGWPGENEVKPGKSQHADGLFTKPSSVDLSVVIVSFNTRQLLLQCLSSVVASCAGVSSEVWVVDNGSSDRSANAVEANFPTVRLVRNPGNFGFARACNQALREAHGRYLLLLNPDADVRPEALSALVSFMEKTPDAGAVGGQLVRADGSFQTSFDNFPTLCTELTNKSLLKRLFPQHYPRSRPGGKDPLEVESLIGASMLVRREVIDSVGPLDEGYFFFLEETDWCLRMRKKGWKVYFLPGVTILHLQGQSARQNPADARIEFFRSRYRFFSLHRSRLSTMVLRAGLLVKLCVDASLSFLAVLGTLFASSRQRERLAVRVKLVAWHVLGCPPHWGIQRTGMQGE